MTRSQVPPGWPTAVPPPDAPAWERRAAGWLLDLCPPEFRGYEVLTRQPRLLAYLAGHQLDAATAGIRSALASVRADLRDVLPPPSMVEAIDVLEREQARLEGVRRSVALVQEALAGTRRPPRL
jgi:hypothetical protein